MRRKRMSIRFDARTLMLLDEIATKTNTKRSVVIRTLIMKGINAILDDAGNIIINEKPI